MLTWNDFSDINAEIQSFQLLTLDTASNGTKYYSVGWNIPSQVDSLTSSAIYTLPNLYVGDTYTFKFSVNATENTLAHSSWFIGIGYIDSSTNEAVSKEGNYLYLTLDNMSGFTGSPNKKSNYKEFTLEYTHKENLGQPCIFIQGTLLDNNTNFWCNLNILYDSVSLTRDPSETEKKLDGILGWLQDIKNSIVGLPQTIKNNFQTFFSDLENKINDFKNTVTEKFTTLSTEFSSYITNLGNNIKGFFEDFWDNISEWFEKFKPRIEIPLDFTDYGSFYNSNFFIPYSDKFHLQLPYNWSLNVYDLDGNNINYIYVEANYDYYFLNANDTEYYQFRITILDDGYSLPESIYIDSGWLSAFLDGLKFQFFSLKLRIDLKIEEIKQDLHDLFIPDEGYFDDLSNRFDLLIEQRFGALVTITDYLVEFFSSFNADTTKEFFDVPIININLMGYSFPIGGWQVRFVPQFNGVEILTNACKFISSVLATFAFFDGLKNKYHEVFGGGE